jgi:Fic family protein
MPTDTFSYSARAGRLISQPTGYRAFVPVPLPPVPSIALDGELLRLLSDADRALARLDAISTLLPNANLFVAMYVRQEAVLSSQIEGTQSTLEDVLAYEANATHNKAPKDVEEVVNYVRAMNHGLKRLPELPLSLRLLREIHKELMHKLRGGERTPGEFRTSQNWIGGPGSTLMNAAFVPPPPHELMRCLGEFEKFIHESKSDTPLLIQCGLAHAQFETIHPFLDGNGRVGRLLIALMLCEANALSRPLLYISHYLKANRAEYYDRCGRERASLRDRAAHRCIARGAACEIRVKRECAQVDRLPIRETYCERQSVQRGAGRVLRNGECVGGQIGKSGLAPTNQFMGSQPRVSLSTLSCAIRQ